MRKRTLKTDLRGSFSMSAGWLFADLLLVLAMLFLAANTMGIHPPLPTVKLTPTPTLTPTPRTLAQLEQKFTEFHIEIDTTKLLAGDQQAAKAVQQKIAGQPFLQGRSAGLIIVYGTTQSDCGRAYAIASKVYTLVLQLGQTNDTFAKIAAYTPLCNNPPHANVNDITIDIFLFAQHSL
jgi:hypothetical protein